MHPADPAPTWSIRADELLVGYRGLPLLPPLSFVVEPGQLWAVLGGNGSGKSTAIRTLLGLQHKLGGHIHCIANTRLSYVPQRNDVDLSIPGRVVDHIRLGTHRGWSVLHPRLQHASRIAMDKAIDLANVRELL